MFGIPRWQWIMLALGVLGLGSEFLGAPAIIIFLLAAAGLIPLAALIGRSTEDLAHYIGPKWGGLLNATFGNAAELIIGAVALSSGLYDLVKASITGSIIGNILLVLGGAFLYGGFKYGVQRFDSREAGRNGTMMLLAIFGLLIPAVFAFTDADPGRVETESIAVALILLALYAAYIVYSFTLGDKDKAIADETYPPSIDEGEEQPSHTPWPRTTAIAVLAGVTVATVILSEAMVGQVETIVRQFGVSEFFIGVVVVPLVGNVAEHFSAILFAGKNRMDITLGIAAGSSTQVALLVAPVLVLLSLVLGPASMNLVFLPIEIVAVAAAGFLFQTICLDGESNWLEGFQLLALYVILAAVFFLVHVPGANLGH
ncbi:MAG: calcium/proton exchanger [Anaerolineae bacterium]